MESSIALLQSKQIETDGKRWLVTLYGPDNFRAALISHYVQSKKGSLKNDAVRYVKEILYELTEEKVSNKVAEEALQKLFYFDDVEFPKPANPTFTFIDLFAGIGGFRLAMQRNQGECVFTSEWDKMAQRTYQANFGEIPFGDITKEETKKWIPKKFDLLCGGFPCQPFSLAGVVKKNSLGRKHGFEDEKQGNLFFHIAEIIEKHRPKAFFLENVKNLISHDKGNTFRVIKKTLEELNYSFHWKVMDGKYYVPQHRERTFMVGFDKNVYKGKEGFTFPDLPSKRLYDLPNVIKPKVDNKFTLSDKLWNYLQQYAQKHKEKGNGFGFGLVNRTDKKLVTRTISARYYKDGAEILVAQDGKNPRRLTPAECAKLQGYPSNFKIPVSDNQAYKQFGNSVVVPLIEAIGEKIAAIL
jgi:DNA (cytosine-5)-methyltransferase 1